MEALRNLEQLQKIFSIMQTNGLDSDHHDSDRFLADFLLFMVKPCGTLDIGDKYRLISEMLPKISPEILNQASVCLDEQDKQNNAEHPTALCLDDKSDFGLSSTDIEDVPMVGLEAMQHANSTLEDFCRSYFMFHGMDVDRPQDVFRYLPLLSFTESYIYQLDGLNEKFSSMSENQVRLSKSKAKQENSQMLAGQFVKFLKTGAFRPLITLLQHHNLWTDRISAELSCGEEYWALERKLCHALANRKKILIEDVLKAIHLKSFDYRVLNLLVYRLRESQVNEVHMEFLSVSEFLVEISDDLFDYEEDVIENKFNVLRMFVEVYGVSVGPVMLAKCIAEAEEKYGKLLKTLDPELSQRYTQRCEEATKEGGSRAGHSLGTWSIPPVIADEELYRSEQLRYNSQVQISH